MGVVVVFFLQQVNRKFSTEFQRVTLLCESILTMPQLKTCKKAKASRRCLVDETVGHICLEGSWRPKDGM